MNSLSRRKFLGWSQAVLAACGAAPLLGSRATAQIAAPPISADDYYTKLGVPTIINAAGTYTYQLRATLLHPTA